jgi:choline transport protein
MSEEIKNASVVVPRSIMASMALNGAFGFAILLAAVYALGNIDDVLGSPTGLAGYSFLDILQTGIGSTSGAAAMGAVIIFMQIFGNVADMAAASRMFWAFSRDKAVPGWKFFVQVRLNTSMALIFTNCAKPIA